MKGQLALRRLLIQRLLRSPAFARSFSNTSTLSTKARPQLPFLTIPVTTTGRKVRYFTTENKQWLRHESKLFLRYNVSIWGTVLCVVAIAYLVNQEWLEKDHPTPHEWTMVTRMRLRGAKAAEAARKRNAQEKNFDETIVSCEEALKRLHDPNIDGAGVKELLDDEPLTIDEVGSAGKDVTSKSEEWRRGYYETMMLLAGTLEQVDGWVKDNTRNLVCPPEFVVGPSNPHPEPMPPGSPGAPKEENCEPAYDSAENTYLRILTTRGFTSKQRMDAALAYGYFLDFKGLTDAAERAYDWALAIASETNDPSAAKPIDRKSFALNSATPPSENVLNAVTALAIHKARAGDTGNALNMFVSILRARRSLPPTPPEGYPRYRMAGAITTWDKVKRMAAAPQYPPPPPDGTQTPWRSPKQLCEEAALCLYIGEILYANKKSSRASDAETLRKREEGLGWTRDGVDLAEEQLRQLDDAAAIVEDPANTKKVCRDCLSTGLSNWQAMVKRLAKKEEEERKSGKAAAGARSTFGSFWSSSKPAEETEGRWAAEEKVVQDRIRRTRELLVELAPASSGIQDLLKA